MAYFPKLATHKIVQDQKLKKLKKQLERTEKQMAEQALLRQKLEELINVRLARAQKTSDITIISQLFRTENFDDIPAQNQNIYSQIRSKLLDEMIAKRTKEFQKKQAAKAAKMKLLTQEKQRIQEAHKQLREKHNMLPRIPSPIGEATERVWGHKYSLYTPLHYDDITHTFTPAFQDGYYTHFPRKKRRRKWFGSKLLFVPTPLFQSLW